MERAGDPGCEDLRVRAHAHLHPSGPRTVGVGTGRLVCVRRARSLTLSTSGPGTLQWLRIRLPVHEDAACRGTAKLMRHNDGACMAQFLKPVCPEPTPCNKRDHTKDQPLHGR
ncbi:hypothetical protein JEQ12_010062 [Ovis aries]|uniref:Uncharacterized protein n=1 Tax=Ovis aries TaxID=9940 RepID=A0A836AP23_SHEEP|nr:hypothetical protein JEQ12_010062 [Ovis aries]